MENDREDEHEHERELAQRILNLFNESGMDDVSVLVIALNVLGSVLSSVRCKECRRIRAERLAELFPVVIQEAMTRPGDTDHLH